MAISRRDAASLEANGRLSLEACAIMSRFDALWEFLSAIQFSDGSPRCSPSMTLFQDQGVLKACLNDKAQGIVAFCTGSSVTALLEALDEGLAADTLDWRKSSQPIKKR